MKILQRYVLRELAFPCAICILTLNFIFMAGYLVKAAHFIIGRGVPMLETFGVIALALPEMVSYTVPTSILTAVLIVFGGLSQNNEIRAIKASGINPMLVIVPALGAGLVMSFLMFVFNDQVTTRAGFELRRTTKKLLLQHPAALVEAGRFVKLSDTIVFLAKQVEGNRLRDIVAYETSDSEKPVRTIIAERGEMVSLPGEPAMQIKLYDGSVSDSQGSSVQAIQFKTYEFPTFGQEDLRQMKKKMRDLSLAELLIRASREKAPEERREIWSAFHHRIAFAFGCFIFVFLGIPVAMLVQRGEIVLSFAISMGAASLYYILFVGAKTVAVEGYLPAVIAYWFPNLALLGAGTKLLRRSIAL